MVSSEVQRTLVKSPPELWAELSDPAALARHLGEFGEIRIVRTDPESTVEWAARNTTGTVSLKPSGWGTSVKLTVTREVADTAPEAESPATIDPDLDESEPAATPDPEPVCPEPAAAVEPEPQAIVEPEPAHVEPAAAVDPESEEAVESERSTSVAPEPTPRRGFLARLFGRRRARATAEPPQSGAQELAHASAPERSPEPPDLFASVREALAPESFAASHPFAALPPPGPTMPEPDAHATSDPLEEPTGDAHEARVVSDIAAELAAAEEVAEEEVTAVLTAVLDRLGAAHHRPFSRA